jgi:hypothetical protein
VNFLGIIKKVYPAISGLASLGGPFGVIGASLVGKALGVADGKMDTTPDGIAAAIAGATPEQMIALKQAEADAQLKVQELGFQNVQEMERLADSDAADARARETKVGDKTPEVGFYLLLVAFVGVIIALFFLPVPEANKSVVFSMIGSLGTIVIGATQYFYGTTRNSNVSQKVIADIAKS